MSRLRSSTLAMVCLAAAALVAALSLAATPAAAQRSLGCEAVWSGPSKDNDFLDCVRNMDRVGSHWRFYMYTGFAAVLFLFTIFGVPIIYCCRCCCCESCITTTNPARSRCCLWIWIVIAIIWACCVCVLIAFGSILMMDTANSTVDDIRVGPLGYFRDTKVEIVALLTDYSVVPPVEPSLDLSEFDEVDVQISEKLDTVQDNYFKYFKIARIVAICVGVVGVVCMLLIIIFACCGCGGCCPVCFSVLYWVFAIIFSLLSIVFTVGIYAGGIICGEVTLQYKREPGIMQWFVVPWCENQFNFRTLSADIDIELAAACTSACDELLTYCDNTNVYNIIGDPNRIFTCGKGLTSSTQCISLDFVAEAVLTSYAKEEVSNLLCTDTTGWTYQERCTPRECQTRCVDYATPPMEAKTWSKQIVQAANFGLNVSTALSYAIPMLDCNFIMDKLASAVEMEKSAEGYTFAKADGVANCSNLYASMIMLGTGFFVGALMFLLGIYILHQGSWIWGDNVRIVSDAPKDDGDAGPTSSDANHGDGEVVAETATKKNAKGGKDSKETKSD